MAPGRIVSPLMPDGAAEAFGPRDGKAKMKGLAGPGSSKADASKKPGLPPDRHPRPVGDLPAVHVNEDGSTIYRMLTYRVRLEQLRGHSIMLHKYGEAPVDPALPRGGGERMACGIIK
jgi:Cu-Zn family superoxide dismutase